MKRPHDDTKRGSLPEVEPLTEARWNRIEGEVFSALDGQAPHGATTDLHKADVARPLRRRAFVAGGVFAAAAAAVAFFGIRNLSSPAVATLSHVETGSGETTLTLGDAKVTVARDSALLVGGDRGAKDEGVLIVLDRGAVLCDVAPRAGRPAFVVQAGNVRVRVVGTRFGVARAASGANVHVEHGVVEVTAAGKTVLLREGETFAASGPVSALPPNAATDPAPRASAEAPIEPDVVDDPLATGIRDGQSAGPRRPSPKGKADGIVRNSGDLQSPAPAASQRSEYEQAARLERENPNAAAAAYRRLADGGGPWASNALFALARLEASRGRNADAKRLAEEYLVRYPRGLNANDARDLASKVR